MIYSYSRREISLCPINPESSLSRGLTQEILSACESYDITLNEEQALLCALHLLYVDQLNEVMNLTRIVDVHQAVHLHVLDSLLLSQYFPSDARSFIDMGSGAGFPGLPLHVLTGLNGTLVDSVGKKMRAVSAILDALQVSGIQAVHSRFEDLGRSAHSYDVAVARAVASLPTLLEYASPLVVCGGHFIAAKGLEDEVELDRGLKVAKIVGFKLIDRYPYHLKLNHENRIVYLFQKVSNSSVKLPRQNGLARRHPLA